LSVLHSVFFTPEDRTPGTHWLGFWVDPKAGMGMMVKQVLMKVGIPAAHLMPD